MTRVGMVRLHPSNFLSGLSVLTHHSVVHQRGFLSPTSGAEAGLLLVANLKKVVSLLFKDLTPYFCYLCNAGLSV